MQLPSRMSHMLSRVRFNIAEALRKENCDALNMAVVRCALCGQHFECDVWATRHGQGEGVEPPPFCANRDYVAAFAPKVDDACK